MTIAELARPLLKAWSSPWPPGRLSNLSAAGIILLFAWQPFRGEYRLGVAALSLLGLALMLPSAGASAGARNTPLRTAALPRLAAVLACFFVPAVLSLSTSVSPGTSLEGVGSIALSILFGTGILAGMLDSQARQLQQRAITIITAAWIAAACVYGAVSVALMGNIATLSPWAAFLTSSRFGRLLTALLPVALWQPIGRQQPLGYGLLAGAGVATILTGQRNNLLGYGVGACLLISQLPRKVAIRIMAVALATTLAVYPLSPELRLRTGAIINGLTGSSQSQSQPSLLDRFNTISSDRGYIYDAAFKMWLRNPLTGIGANAFKEAYPTFADQRDAIRFANPPAPHSVYVGMVAQTGLIGLAGLALAIALLIRWGRAAARTPISLEAARPYAASLVVMLFPLITQDDFYDSTFSTTFIYMVCGLISAPWLGTSSAHPQTPEPAPDRLDPSIDPGPEGSEPSAHAR